MIPTLTALLQTITGKAVLGLTIATASVGGAAAAGAPVPIVQDLVPGAEHAAVATSDSTTTTTTTTTAAEEPAEAAAPIEVAEEAGEADALDNHGEVVSEFATTTELEGCERGQAVSAVARGELDPASPTFDADLTAYLDQLDHCGTEETEAPAEAVVPAEEPENHGQVVSEFATTTELEGCERGQAVSAVARGELDPASPTFDADLTAHLDQLEHCTATDDEAPEAPVAEDDAEQAGPPADKPAKPAKPDHAGKGRPDHAGNGKP